MDAGDAEELEGVGSNQLLPAQRTKLKTSQMALKHSSLNRVARNAEQKRIMMENDAFLKRLQNQQSNYNVFEWEHKRKDQVKNIQRICKYEPAMAMRSKRGSSRRRGGVAKKNVLLLQALNDHVYSTGEAELGAGPVPDPADLTKKMWYQSLRNGPNKRIYE